jgi:heterodisulfide reductase subunit A2
MIQCVGCRNEDRNYCSRICCSESIKNALKLKEINPKMDIYILFRDMRTYGFSEDYYREASASKMSSSSAMSRKTNLRWNLVRRRAGLFLRVTVPDYILGKKLEIDADILALAAAVIPSAGTRKYPNCSR